MVQMLQMLPAYCLILLTVQTPAARSCSFHEHILYRRHNNLSPGALTRQDRCAEACTHQPGRPASDEEDNGASMCSSHTREDKVAVVTRCNQK